MELYFSLGFSDAQLGNKSGLWYRLYLLMLFCQIMWLYLNDCPAKEEDMLGWAATSID